MRLDHRLRYLFQSEYTLCFLMPCNIDASKLPFSQFFSDIELLYHGKFATVAGHRRLSSRRDDFERRNDGFCVFRLVLVGFNVDEGSGVEASVVGAF